MLEFQGRLQKFCGGVSRRNFLRVGAMGVGGLTMGDLLRLKAQGAVAPSAGNKAVIMVVLPGGPTHLDTYDLKPDAPMEFRGEFKPIRTKVPGMDICELMPLQAKIADKLAVIRGLKMVDDHTNWQVHTGYTTNQKRPAFGSIVSRMKGANANGLPAYVSLMGGGASEEPGYVGAAHRPFVPSGPGLQNMSLASGVTLDRLQDRKTLLGTFDCMNRDMDNRGEIAGTDAFTARALEMISSAKARDAFDVTKESDKVKAKYGKIPQFLQARRLVEAGISVVTVAYGGWDTHAGNFTSMKKQIPELDQGLHALITDLHERGMEKDVAVCVWGEFGRTPRINKDAGRDHWGPTAIAMMAGGGLNVGQVVGASDARGERPVGKPITVESVMATLYGVLGVDPSRTILDGAGRPQYILDNRDPIAELI